ncbi:MAG TPA: TetR/AcrR family transcriptional regulator [Acidimicrobiales bacterium]|nr:TetR/AcrR family transcriptional regulator [Acidimicrobiales bacterium]
MANNVRERILEATYACVARYGLAKTTVEDAAREAKLSRATIYRYFPGGKDQLIGDTVAWESARFFQRLAEAVADAGDFARLLEDALMFAHRAIEEHAVLQKVLQTEPEKLLPHLTVGSDRLVVLIKDFLYPALEREHLRRGVGTEQAAEYLGRMVLSYIGAQGRWDLTDRVQVASLVRTEFLAGIVEPTGLSGVTTNT